MPRTSKKKAEATPKASTSSGSQGTSKRMSQAKRAGLLFPPKRFTNRLRHGNYARRIGLGSGLYLAAILEYLVAEVMELAGKAALDNNKRRISPRHIMMAVRNDNELSELLKFVHFNEGGVLPSIHRILLHTLQQRRKLQKEGELPSDNILSSQIEETTPHGDAMIFAEGPSQNKVLIQTIKKERKHAEDDSDEKKRERKKKKKLIKEEGEGSEGSKTKSEGTRRKSEGSKEKRKSSKESSSGSTKEEMRKKKKSSISSPKSSY